MPRLSALLSFFRASRIKAARPPREWERQELDSAGHPHARNTLTVGAGGVRMRRDWSGSVQISEVSLGEFLEGCLQDVIAQRFGRELLDEVISEAKRLPATGSSRRLLSADRALEIRHETEPGPSDDFYGVAEHYWRVVHRPSGKVLMQFEGGDYGHRWTGTRNVRFSEEGGALIVTSERGEDRVDLPAIPSA